jgi:hypothetical protein
MARTRFEIRNDWEAMRDCGRSGREAARVRQMQQVASATLPEVGQNYIIDNYGVVTVIAARTGSVKIKYKKGKVEKETWVHPRLFNL